VGVKVAAAIVLWNSWRGRLGRRRDGRERGEGEMKGKDEWMQRSESREGGREAGREGWEGGAR